MDRIAEEHPDLIGTEGEYLDSFNKKLDDLINELDDPVAKNQLLELESQASRPNSDIPESPQVSRVQNQADQIPQKLNNAQIENTKPPEFSTNLKPTEEILPDARLPEEPKGKQSQDQLLESKESPDLNNPQNSRPSELPNKTNVIQDSTLSGKVLEAPKSDLIQKPENLGGKTKERGLIQTIDENPNFKQETKEFRKDTTYETRNSNDLFDRATERVKTQDSESLAKEIRMKSRKESNWTDEEVATGYELVRKYESEGLLDEAAELEDALARKATEGGQMIQAYYRFGKMTPEGAIREANKVLEKAMPKAKAQKLKEATANVIKDFNKANKKAIEDILNFCPPGSFS